MEPKVFVPLLFNVHILTWSGRNSAKTGEVFKSRTVLVIWDACNYRTYPRVNRFAHLELLLLNRLLRQGRGLHEIALNDLQLEDDQN